MDWLPRWPFRMSGCRGVERGPANWFRNANAPPTACRNSGSAVICASELTAHRGAVEKSSKLGAVSEGTRNFQGPLPTCPDFPVPGGLRRCRGDVL